MKFTLIVCTYMRPAPLLQLLQSVRAQSLYPDEILIVDGSKNHDTRKMLQENLFSNLHYFLVDDKDRGLTKQRNFGITKVNNASDVVCFLDDDTVLTANYFEEIMQTYALYPKALGVGGYIVNESKFTFVGQNYTPNLKEFYYDGWKIKDGTRFILRKLLKLDSDQPPGYSSNYSHGRSVGFLPPSGKIYPVEQLMGGVSSFRKIVFETLQFSTYFEGYGLYEDADFTIRVSKTGPLYLNTAAKLNHYHNEAGRPNKYTYGKMVVRNGWYVWRVKNPNPTFIHQWKWNCITIVLTLIRFSNTFTTAKHKEAFTEALGRTVGWFSLFFNKPR
ncbi:glycosyltransferase family 2 protein [Flavobacterium psychrophilum]|uniref:glycosyltransferase family 2 protein n=1 Tax=Flavobacterium psychrophilum TaxID=96345 RepID=UPI000B7C2882|nr:glycosyltransferase family 2 protein [Flavobacterium psychrophilum]SNB11983.1 Glycosyl transferase, group 2 family protein [Flavobacterium psychrophilum]